MAPLHVRELVRGDREDLALGEAAVEQRVVKNDAARRSDARDVGICGRRAPARVGDAHVVYLDAHAPRELLDLRGELAVGQRLDAVEERLDDERLREDEHGGDPDQGRRSRRPPAPAEAAGQPERPRYGDRHEHGLHRE